MIDAFAKVPWWCLLLGLLWSAYQGFRGALEQKVNSNIPLPGSEKKYSDYLKKPWQRWVVLYIHDFFFRFFCTAAGFVALYAAIASLEGAPIREHSPGSLAFSGFAFLVGVIGVGGQLHNVILFGKWPKS